MVLGWPIRVSQRVDNALRERFGRVPIKSNVNLAISFCPEFDVSLSEDP